MRRRWLPAAVLAGFGAALAHADLAGSKHNLSVSGPGPITATTESRICVFCHTPHHASPAVPLWNHPLSAVAAYSTYSSTTLTVPTPLQQPTGSTKLCLSCHDGTVALGQTVNDGLIALQNTGADGRMPPGASNLGTDLQDDHPVSFQRNSGNPETSDPPPGDPVRLDAAGEVQCTSCHEPHTEDLDPVTRRFLVKINQASAVCAACHQVDFWSANPSAHKTSTRAYTSAQGAHTVIIEKSGKAYKAPGVIMPNSTLVGAKGYGGNFVLTIRAGEKTEQLECAAVVVATGGGWADLKGPLAKACKSAVTLYRLQEMLETGAAPKGPVVIVDTPDPAGKSMAVQDFAWDDALDLAMRAKKMAPLEEVYVVFQEMRAFGLSELEYKEAAELGVRFIRYERTAGPKIDPKEPTRMTVKDLSQSEVISIPVGTLAFAAIPANRDNAGIADALRIPMSPEGGVRRGSIQRWPLSTPRPGVFVCGSAVFPKGRDTAEAEGEAAGLMAGRFAMQGTIEYGGVVAEVDQDKCSACLTCVRTCPYEAPFIGAAGKAEIRVQACQGCGICAGVCPSKAIELRNFTDDQIAQETRTMLGGDF